MLSTEAQNLLLVQSCCEIICFDAVLSDTKYRFILVYRPPHSSFNNNELFDASESLSVLIQGLFHRHFTTILLGDFNLPHIDWLNACTINNDFVHNCLYDCFLDLGLTQFVHEPTRLNFCGVSNVLDIILSNDPLAVSDVNVCEPLGTSDHNVVSFSLLVPGPANIHSKPDCSNTRLPVYNWSAGNYDAINELLMSFDWNDLFSFNFSANSLWLSFKNIVWPMIDLHVPKKLVHHTAKYRPRQYPKHIRKLLSRKAAIWRTLRFVDTAELKQNYKNVARACKLAILEFDARREEHILDANNLGAFYKFVNNKLGSHHGIAPLHDSSGNLVVSDLEKANLINTYLHSIFTLDDGTLPAFPRRVPDTSPDICDIQITQSIILKIISKLKSNSAAGPDGLPPIFYQKTGHFLNFLSFNIIPKHY